MGRGWKLSWSDPNAVHAHADSAGCAAEHLPLSIHLTLGRAVPFDVVPVCKTHDSSDY